MDFLQMFLPRPFNELFIFLYIYFLIGQKCFAANINKLLYPTLIGLENHSNFTAFNILLTNTAISLDFVLPGENGNLKSDRENSLPNSLPAGNLARFHRHLISNEKGRPRGRPFLH